LQKHFSSLSDRFAIIWEGPYGSWQDPKYESLGFGGPSRAIESDAVKDMTDGNGTGGYNAVLAIYHCYGGDTRGTGLYAEDFGLDIGGE
jgi:hypothetical protein